MKIKAIVVMVLLFASLSQSVFAQSAYLEDGVGGSGFSVNGVIDDSGFSTMGLCAAYSIGGIMDFGVNLSTEQGNIDDYESTDLSFSLLYNLVIIKQNQTQPLNVQLEGSYGYVNTASAFLDNYSRRRTGQGFILGVFIYHNFFSSSLLGFNAGGKLEYSNYITTTYNYTYPDTPTIITEVRSEDIKYGGAVSLTLHPDQWPLFNVGLTVFYNSSEEILEYVPSISIISPQY